MVAISTGKVNDPGERTVVPGAEEFKMNHNKAQRGLFGPPIPWS
jgi:hypothetical protein